MKSEKNIQIINYIGFFLIPFVYFSISWFFPWDSLQSEGTVSISYVFDVIFCLAIFLGFKRKDYIGKINILGLLLQLLVVVLLACLFVYISFEMKLNAPFKYVDHLLLQILILAPIIEEAVFRGAFIEFAEKLKLNFIVSISINSVLFSLSHLPAIWNLPNEFHSFIGFQLFYTVILGGICTYSRLKTKGLISPILLHFCFNLVFYIAVIKYGL